MKIAALIAVALVLAPLGAAKSKPRVVELVNATWRCAKEVNVDLVKVTITDNTAKDAISLGSNCSGRIGRVEVISNGADGIKVQNASLSAAHDLVIEGGYVKCNGVAPGAHQDAMQVMGGARITLNGVFLGCLGNSQFFINKAGGGKTNPTDVVCEGCTFGSGSNSALFIAYSLRSGAKNSFVCGRTRISPAAVEAVNVNNLRLILADPRCR